MRKLTCIILLTLSLQLFAKEQSTVEVRNLYQKAAHDANSCKKLLSVLSSYNENINPLLAGYKACATMMMANHLINPYNKLSNFSQGKNLLEKCIKADSKNIELRFLRFSVQTKAPSFLGYTRSIEADKKFLINSISGVRDSDLKKIIVSFLKGSEYLTSGEKESLNN